MNSVRLRAAALRLYDDVELALWAGLLAFVLYFAAVVVPAIPAAKARAERLRAQDIAAEHDHYCNKFGMPEGHPGHAQCALDLGAFRATIEKRFADELQPF